MTFVVFPSSISAQFAGILERVEENISEAADGFPSAQRSEAERGELRKAQVLGEEALRLGTQFTAPAVVGGARGTYGILRGYASQARNVAAQELIREQLLRSRGIDPSSAQRQRLEDCLEKRARFLCENGFR